MKKFKLKKKEITAITTAIALILLAIFAKDDFVTLFQNNNTTSDVSGLVTVNDTKEGNKIKDENSINNNNNNDNSTVDSSKFIEAKVTRIVDGDTIVVNIQGTEKKVRMIGMNTPESTTKIEKFGKEASNYTTQKLTDKTVYLEKDVNETDKYGRLLRYVWLEIPNEITETTIKEKMFNAILVIEGYAQVATYPPDIKYVDYFTKIQTIAKDANLGLWQYK